MWKDWYWANKKRIQNKVKERCKTYYWKHPLTRLAKFLKRKDKQSKITSVDLWRLAHKQKMICPLSGRRLTNESISVDHIIHRSNGGKADLTNLRLVAKEINLARHILNDEQFIQMCKDVTEYNSLL